MTSLVATILWTATALVAPTAAPAPTQPEADQPSSAKAATLLAQDDEKPPSTTTGRPPVPSLKNLKKIQRPVGKPSMTTRGGRVQPVKPTLRPRGGTSRPGPGLDRGKGLPGGRIRTPRTGLPGTAGSSSRKLRSDDDRAPKARAEAKARAESKDAEAKSTGGHGATGGADARDTDRRCRPLPRNVKVRMNFNEAEVLEIVQWISEQTCKNFIIGDGIRGGKITILSNTPVTATEAYRAFLAALNVNNMTVVRVGNFYKIQMKRDAAKDTIPTYVGENPDIPQLDMMVTRLVQMKYIDANQVNGTVKQLTSKDGDSYPYAPTNSLIISDTGSNMFRIMKILEQLDTPLGQEEIRVIQVEYALATELAGTLEEIFGQQGGGRGGKSSPAQHIRPTRGKAARTDPAGDDEDVSVSKIIADERTNQLVVVATARSFARLQELIDKLDVPIPGEGQIQVVYLEHADAEELANTLTSLSQGSGTGARRIGGKASSKGKAGRPAKAAELFQGEVKVTADKATNSLVIVASQNDYRSLQKVIGKLDIARRQVFVEAVIMEVNMDTTKDVGLAFHTGAAAEIGGKTVPLIFGTQFKSQGQNVNSLSVVNNLNMLGFLSGLRGPDLEGTESILGNIALPSFGVVLQALQTDSNVDVLSTPHILTSDNEEAEIKVGENIPIPAGYGGGLGGLGNLAGLASSAGLAGSTGLNSSRLGGLSGIGGLMGGYGMGAINRQEVGLTLKIKPQINEGDYIRMELEEELSEVKDTSNPLGPTTTKRSAKTVVVVKDQQTVVVGGLMRDKIDMGESKIPVLGDIPVIGWLFRSKRSQKTKTNLLLFLTPYVIESQEDFRSIFERKIRERREFMERFYGKGRRYEAFIDFRRKRGPLADLHLHMTQEMAKLENGGPGAGTEVLITPDGSGAIHDKAPDGTGAVEKKKPAAPPPEAAPAGDDPLEPDAAAVDVGGEQDSLQVE